MRPFLIFLHLAGVIVWIGGMFFAHFCLRPVVAEQLPSAQRLHLLAAVLGRFFVAVGLAIVLILLSGFVSLKIIGFAQAPLHWHVMSGLGLLMVGIFVVIYFRFYPRLRNGVQAEDWPLAGAAMNRIRQLVATNLLLGGLTLMVATLGAYFVK